MQTRLNFDDGTFTMLDLSGNGLTLKPRKKSSRFELVMCGRSHAGRRLPRKNRVYRGDSPAAVEATFLKALHDTEKSVDVYADDE